MAKRSIATRINNYVFAVVSALLLVLSNPALAQEKDQAKENPDSWKEYPVSILESQIGYHPGNIKRVYLRSLQENPPADFLPGKFSLVDSGTGKEVFNGDVTRWGKKWESWWWVLDFTPVRNEGVYQVKAGKLISSKFEIKEGVFHKADLDVVALDQLEHRIHKGLEDKRAGMPGKYVNCGDDVRIYMDCGSPYSELEPVGTCVYALMELHDLLGDRFSAKNRERMIRLAALGADYFVAAQRHTDDPETDGMFHHSLLVNTRDTWAGNIFTYLDTAYGMALTAKAHKFFKDRDPDRAARYLKTSRKAWELCVRRPYHTKADRKIPDGCNAFFWNAPHGIQDTFGKCLYNILDSEWKMPDVLRTRDRLPFIQGSALLYEITGEKVFLDKAVEFADAVMERQFTDWENPIEGCFGNFYEFPGNDNVFFHEFMQGGFWWQGNVEAMNLEGFMHLVSLAPEHSKAAMWVNTVKTYAENYAQRATTVNPLGIYPVACYRDAEHGGLKNFQNILMGSSCVYGFSTRNFMMLGAFLKDADFQLNAIAGINFIAGLNPGVPNAYNDTAWDARTLIMGVGRSWFGPAGEPADTARGSVPNGFCASPQFWHTTGYTNFISFQPDKPAGLINSGGGLQFNEGWILHSHAYVHGVARIEAPYRLDLTVMDDGKQVQAKVAVKLNECAEPNTAISREYETGKDGKMVITDLPAPASGTVSIVYGNSTIVRPVAVISGAGDSITVDFSREISVDINLPEKTGIGSAGKAGFTVLNSGNKKVDVRVLLSAAGVELGNNELKLALEPGEKKDVKIPFKAGSEVMPYLVRALVVEGAPRREFYAEGRIASGVKQ